MSELNKQSKKRRRTRAERKGEIETKIVEATIHLINTDGIANLTIARIKKQSGVAWGANLFTSKYDLLLTICTIAVQQTLEQLAALRSQGLSLEERVSTIVNLMSDIYQNPVFHACGEIYSNPPRDPDIQKKMREELKAARIKIDKAWISYFEGLAIPNDKIIFMRLFVNLTMHGLTKSSELTDAVGREWTFPTKDFEKRTIDFLVNVISDEFAASIRDSARTTRPAHSLSQTGIRKTSP